MKKFVWFVLAIALPMMVSCNSKKSASDETVQNQEVSDEEALTQSVNPDLPLDPEDIFFEVVDEMPWFPGGDTDALVKFFCDNLKYPEQCKEEGIEGTVVMNFYIEKDGSVTDIKELNPGDANPLFVEEAARVIALTKWRPGKDKGEEVRCGVVMPVKFKLDR